MSGTWLIEYGKDGVWHPAKFTPPKASFREAMQLAKAMRRLAPEKMVRVISRTTRRYFLVP